MSPDAKREAVIAALRQAITAWIATDGKEGGRRLRDGLHALSAVPSMRRELGGKGGRPKRRKAA